MADDHKKVLDYILASHSPVIGGTIHRMREKYPHLKDQDPGDLYEAATNAAMTAIHGHDPDRGAKLSTYMSQKIANALLQRFQPKDVAATDRAMASATRPAQQSDIDSVRSTMPSASRGEIESAGGSVSEDGATSGVSIIRNTAADFAARNPHMRAELERKTKNYEVQQAKKQPVMQEAPPEPPKPKPEQPKMIIRRKQVESSLQPEHLDRMKRIDGKKNDFEKTRRSSDEVLIKGAARRLAPNPTGYRDMSDLSAAYEPQTNESVNKRGQLALLGGLIDKGYNNAYKHIDGKMHVLLHRGMSDSNEHGYERKKDGSLAHKKHGMYTDDFDYADSFGAGAHATHFDKPGTHRATHSVWVPLDHVVGNSHYEGKAQMHQAANGVGDYKDISEEDIENHRAYQDVSDYYEAVDRPNHIVVKPGEYKHASPEEVAAHRSSVAGHYLKDPDPSVRRFAFRNPHHTRDHFIRGVNDADADVAAVALTSPHAESHELLHIARNDKDPKIRSAALAALNKKKGPQ